ncbi:hypothetical protein FXO37_19380 [Capsicum annuum]|nr:hypothetical protein FXO37_19380 [Capsicum annuum]
MINLAPPPYLCCACKCEECKAKYDGVINTVNALTVDVKELISNSSIIRSKRISVSFTPLEIKAKSRKKAISKALSSIEKNKNFGSDKDGEEGRISPSLANTGNKTSDVIESLDFPVNFDNPEDVFARISTELLDTAKDNIDRLLIMSSQDLLLPENCSALSVALSIYAAAQDLSAERALALEKLKENLPYFSLTLRRSKKDQEKYYKKVTKK